jgi:hypothetical protein
MAIEPLKVLAAASLRRWAAEWARALEELLSGDRRGRQRAWAAGERCVSELSECLTRWEALPPPAEASRLAELGAACLKLEIVLVRGTFAVGDEGDSSALQPLAGLAERICALTRSISAETLLLSRAALGPCPAPRRRAVTR